MLACEVRDHGKKYLRENDLSDVSTCTYRHVTGIRFLCRAGGTNVTFTFHGRDFHGALVHGTFHLESILIAFYVNSM
ncbi:hypothetical protein ACTXT7_013037 [Hymenolepis weldensis]